MYLDNLYGVKDLYAGVPAVIGSRGIEKIIELDLDQDLLRICLALGRSDWMLMRMNIRLG